MNWTPRITALESETQQLVKQSSTDCTVNLYLAGALVAAIDHILHSIHFSASSRLFARFFHMLTGDHIVRIHILAFGNVSSLYRLI